jgi:hypothetical protein
MTGPDPLVMPREPGMTSRDKAFRAVSCVVQTLQMVAVVLAFGLLLLVAYTMFMAWLFLRQPIVPAG